MPNFGRDSTGSGYDETAGYRIAIKFTSFPGATGSTVTTFYANTDWDSARDFILGIYSHNSGTDLPNARLEQVTIAKSGSSTGEWISGAAAGTTSLTNGTTYWLAYVSSVTTGGTNGISFTTGGRLAYNGPSDTTLSDPWVGGNVDTNFLGSLYIVYTEPGGRKRIWAVT